MLAQAHQFTAADSARIIIWSFVLIVVIILAFVAVARVKRRIRDDVDANPTAAAGFTLSDLRRMHRDGLIDDDELERAKAKLVEAAKRGAGPGLRRTANEPEPPQPADASSLEFLDEPPAGGAESPPSS